MLRKLGITTNGPTTITSVLDEIEKSNLPESAKKELTSILRKAETLDKSTHRNSIVATSQGPAISEIDALAKQFIQKSGTPLDLAAARVEIRKLHPDLAEQERAEYRHF